MEASPAEEPLKNLSSELQCPVFTDDDEFFIEEFAFWTEGVLLCLIAVTGILANTLGSIVLCQRSMRNR